MIHTLEPVFFENSELLILGTFPSVQSREGNFYYHNPQNRFWKVLAKVVKEETPVTIEDKKELLRRNKVAIWDVIHSCDIKGSSDSSISNVVPNNIGFLLQHTKVTSIIGNGNQAFRLYYKYCYPDVGREMIGLPSTSPANAAYSLEKLVEIWKEKIGKNEEHHI